HRLAGADWDRIGALQAFADERGVSILDVALGGLAAQAAVASVIAGATRPEQVEANVRAALWQPNAEDLDTLAALNTERGPPTTLPAPQPGPCSSGTPLRRTGPP